MGQFALGLRSLLIRLSIFFVMAALLAWALGGTLWPRAEVRDFDAVSYGGREWYWRLAVGGRQPGEVRYTMMVREPGGEANPFDNRSWIEVSGPVGTEDALYYAGRAWFNPGELWRIERIGEAETMTTLLVQDRLAVEQQLARVREGLALQSADEIRSQRAALLEPTADRP